MDIKRDANMSRCGRYRYLLSRIKAYSNLNVIAYNDSSRPIR